MGVDFSNAHRAMNAQQHLATYAAFTKIMIFGCVIVMLTLVGMALFLT